MNKQYYETSDRETASVLRAFFPLATIHDDNGRKVWIFEWSDELEKIKTEYDRGVLTVNAGQLIAAQEAIKRTIYNH